MERLKLSITIEFDDDYDIDSDVVIEKLLECLPSTYQYGESEFACVESYGIKVDE